MVEAWRVDFFIIWHESLTTFELNLCELFYTTALQLSFSRFILVFVFLFLAGRQAGQGIYLEYD